LLVFVVEQSSWLKIGCLTLAVSTSRIANDNVFERRR